MAEFVSPYRFIEPYISPMAPLVAKGVDQGMDIAKVEAQMPYMLAHARQAEATAKAKELETKRAVEAYNQLYGGTSLPGSGPMTPDKALLYTYAGLKEPHTWAPKYHFEGGVGQYYVTDPTKGTASAFDVPGAIIPKEVKTIPIGQSNQPVTTTKRGDINIIPGTGGLRFQPRETVEEAAEKEAAKARRKLEIEGSPEGLAITREKGRAQRESFEDWSKKEAIKQRNRQNAVSFAAQYNMRVVENVDPDTNEVSYSYEPVTSIKGKAAPHRGKPQNIYNASNPAERSTIMPGEPIPEGWVYGNPPKAGKKLSLEDILNAETTLGSTPKDHVLKGKPAGKYKVDGKIIKWDGAKEL